MQEQQDINCKITKIELVETLLHYLSLEMAEAAQEKR
jgi:hypothetical protein